MQIASLVEKALETCQNKADFTVEDIFETDMLARKTVENSVI